MNARPTMEVLVSTPLLAKHDKPGLFATLPPWGLVVAGLVFLTLAGLVFWVNKKKLEKESLILELAGVFLGIGALFALYRGIFGS